MSSRSPINSSADSMISALEDLAVMEDAVMVLKISCPQWTAIASIGNEPKTQQTVTGFV